MTGSRWIALAALTAVEVGAGASAEAQVGAQPEEQIVETHPPPRIPLWEAAVGVRTVFIKSPAFDPFSNNDAFAQFSLSGSRVLARAHRVALAAGLVLDVGNTDSSARGEPSQLSLTRVAALIEGRYQPWSRLYGFVRVAPGWLHGSASLDDASSPNGASLTTSFDAFSVDTSAGAAFRLGSLGASKLSAWLIADGGYAWVQSKPLVLAPNLGDNQNKAGTLDLGSLAPSGGFFRVALALAY
jgi:hypothetical protein